jgi:hypothetical protein
MILCPSDGTGDATEFPDCPTEIGVQALPP